MRRGDKKQLLEQGGITKLLGEGKTRSLKTVMTDRSRAHGGDESPVTRTCDAIVLSAVDIIWSRQMKANLAEDAI